MTSPLLARPGAVAVEGGTVAAHYGDPLREQRLLAEAGGLVDRSDRDVVVVPGADRLTWLHSLTSQHLERLGDATGSEALILSPQGHVEHHFAGVDDGEVFLASTEPGRGSALIDFLTSMRFMLRVEIEPVHDIAVIARRGGEAFVPRADLVRLGAEMGPPSGTWAHEALRIVVGRPRLGLDTDHRTIPNEVGWIGTAVHMDKGCYRGQETVARVHTLGRPPRRLVLLHLDGSADRLPALGSPLVLDGREVGRVGSSARHHELGPVGLGLVKRSVPTQAELLADEVAASQEVLVDPEVGLHVRPRL
jgi:tRNA-modifying protein YgfZ